MALTNYIAQSVICVFIFYGIGFGLFGQLDRGFQLLITFGIWIIQYVWSKAWLDRFQFGPLEWLWRSLAYGKNSTHAKVNFNDWHTGVKHMVM